ncbi:hypothetical protein EDB81DRAFT_436398 [Dactylonectria macrodidyma]|uniref:J domain-containing protein n=1 Tax=Dactylonectria macrodidyma TaxID=307937 RepID=A0A9P9JAX0_9HYPO|nr:hypothetical protein EDB81DRAFT_436398 [Dactylonectria macrodidyma]
MTSLPPDPYKTLGVSKDAQITEIRSAHRKLVLKCHPDKVQDPDLKALAQDEFQKVQRAYEILSDEKERQRYDDQARLAELRKQMQSKANTSSPRATPTTYKYEVRTAEPRPSSYKSTPGTSPSTKAFYPRSYEETRGPQIFDAEPRVRREASYSDKPSKREAEREREKKEERERSKKLAENLRRMEKEAKEQKEARRAEKKKEREKERKREAADKKSHSKPYIESYEDEVLVKEKKKSSKKHDEKRDRSSHREEAMPRMNTVHDPMPEEPYLEGKVADTFDQALSYIQAKNRSKAYHATRVQPPAAPTPPPAPGQSSPFAPPDDDARRSSARVRRGSSGEKKAHKKPSNEVLDDPIIVNTSPSARYAGRSATTATAAAGLSGSPPRRELHRQYSSPVPEMPSRSMPTMSRSQTFTAGLYPEMADPRGRGRSKQHPQIQEESDSEDDRAQRHRERKHRSSKKYRSPSRPAQQVHQYKVDSKGHATLHTTYSRSMEPMVDSYSYYPNTHGIQVQETRPSMSARDASYSSSPGNYMPFHKVKTSRAYDYDDVAFSNNYPHHDEYAEAY